MILFRILWAYGSDVCITTNLVTEPTKLRIKCRNLKKKFKSVVNADKSEIGAKKSWNIVNSAFVAKLALLNSELTELQFVKADAEEKIRVC